jgi:hypothetical protein
MFEQGKRFQSKISSGNPYSVFSFRLLIRLFKLYIDTNHLYRLNVQRPRRVPSLNPGSPDGFTPFFELANGSGCKSKPAAEVHHGAHPFTLFHTQAIQYRCGGGVDMTAFVRRAYLCGWDKLTRKNFDHRKAWLVERMKTLSNIFSIHCAAYAAMQNHLHLCVYVDCEQAAKWSDDEVISRWGKLFPGGLAGLYAKNERAEDTHPTATYIKDRHSTNNHEVPVLLFAFTDFLGVFIFFHGHSSPTNSQSPLTPVFPDTPSLFLFGCVEESGNRHYPKITRCLSY